MPLKSDGPGIYSMMRYQPSLNLIL